MINKLISTCILVVLSSVAFAQNNAAIIAEVDSKLQENKYEESLALLSETIAIDSLDYNLYVKRAEVCQKLFLYQNAQDDYVMALNLKPYDATTYVAVSAFHLELQYFNEAIREATFGLKLVAKEEDTQENKRIRALLLDTRAKAYAATGKSELAINDYDSILLNAPDDNFVILTFISMASVLQEAGRKEEAIATLETCIAQFPKTILAYINLAFFYLDKEEYQLAINLNTEAIKVAVELEKEANGDVNLPDDIVLQQGGDTIMMGLAYNNRGYAYYKLNNLDEALSDINKSLALYPDNPYAYKNRALVYIAQKQSTLACNDIDKAIALYYIEQYGNEILEMQQANCK